MYMISQVSPQHNSSRMSLPMFKDGDNKLSSSYVWFGAVFRYGQRKSLPKKIPSQLHRVDEPRRLDADPYQQLVRG